MHVSGQILFVGKIHLRMDWIIAKEDARAYISNILLTFIPLEISTELVSLCLFSVHIQILVV